MYTLHEDWVHTCVLFVLDALHRNNDQQKHTVWELENSWVNLMFCFLALHIHSMSTISIKHAYIYEIFVLFHINLSVEDPLNSEVLQQRILRQQMKAGGRSYIWDEINGRLSCIPYTGQGLPVLSLSTSLLHWKQWCFNVFFGPSLVFQWG